MRCEETEQDCERMTDIGSCKTCRYFDLKDGDSETNNWCRHNNRPAINEGLCGHYKLMIRPCPFCGGEVELKDKFDGADETFFIHCTKCHMWFEKFDWRGYGHAHIIEEWNRGGE